MKLVFIVMFVVLCSAFGVKFVFAGPRSEIKSGDTTALRSADKSSTKWLTCTNSTKGACTWTKCPDVDTNAKGWSPCLEEMTFFIEGKRKGDIKSGDTVTLKSVKYGTLLRCTNSTRVPCSVMKDTRGPLKGGKWLKYSYATFQIFSGDAEDTSPVDNGDVVGFKYPFSSNGAWLTYYDGQFYPRYCSKNSKKPCAAENKPTGFVIFKVPKVLN